jgi:hypothetical protein
MVYNTHSIPYPPFFRNRKYAANGLSTEKPFVRQRFSTAFAAKKIFFEKFFGKLLQNLPKYGNIMLPAKRKKESLSDGKANQGVIG